jgi:putative membrane protein
VNAQPRRTAPVGLLVSAIAGLRQSVAAIVALTYVGRDMGPILWVGLGVAVLILSINVFFAGLSWHRLTFHVGAEDIRVESGILSRAARSVPYERIQDVSLEQGLLARLFGLVVVRFETGAGGADDITLSYLTEAEGEELRNLVRRRRDRAAPVASEAIVDAPEKSEVLFAMDPRRILTFGAFEFSLAVVAVIFGVTQQFDFLLPFDLWDLDEWERRLAGPGARLAALGPMAQAVGAAIAVATLLAVGFLTGIVRTALREWGFVLERTERGFRRRRGLLTRTDVVMPMHRVQAMRIGTRIVRRLFGWHGLKFVSLAQDEGAANHVVAPFGKVEELWPVAGKAGFEPPADDLAWYQAARAYRSDSIVLVAIIPVALAFVPIALGYPLFAAIPLAIGALLVAGEFIAWRNTWHALDARQVLSRSGWLAPGLEIAPRVKLQSVDFRQGPLARRHGYGTLHLGLAGGTFAIGGVPVQRARELSRAILESVTATDYSEMNG